MDFLVAFCCLLLSPDIQPINDLFRDPVELRLVKRAFVGRPEFTVRLFAILLNNDSVRYPGTARSVFEMQRKRRHRVHMPRTIVVDDRNHDLFTFRVCPAICQPILV